MDSGYFLSPDPIGLLGGMQNSLYAPNLLEWIDPLGLDKGKIPEKHIDDLPPVEDGYTRLYRAVGPDEYNDLLNNGGKFRGNPLGGTLEDKQFTLSSGGALRFADFYPDASAIISVDVPSKFVNSAFSGMDSHIMNGISISRDALDQFNQHTKNIFLLTGY